MHSEVDESANPVPIWATVELHDRLGHALLPGGALDHVVRRALRPLSLRHDALAVAAAPFAARLLAGHGARHLRQPRAQPAYNAPQTTSRLSGSLCQARLWK